MIVSADKTTSIGCKNC